MLKNYLFLIFIFVFMPLLCIGQLERTTLNYSYNESINDKNIYAIVEKMRFNEIDESEKKRFLHKLRKKKNHATVQLYHGAYYLWKSKPDSALIFLTKSLNNPKASLQVKCMSNLLIGYNHYSLSECDKAVERYQAGGKIANQLNSSRLKLNAAYGVGSAEYCAGNYKNSIFYMKRALTLLPINGETLTEISVNNFIAEAYKFLDKKDSTNHYYQLSIDIIENEKSRLSDSSPKLLIRYNQMKIEVLEGLERPEEAMHLSKINLNLALQIKDYDLAYFDAKLIEGYYSDQQVYDSAYKYVIIADSVAAVNRGQEYFKALEEAEANYKVKEQKNKIKLLKREQENFFLLATLIIGGLLILILIAIIIVRKRKVELKKRELTIKHVHEQLMLSQATLSEFKNSIEKKDEMLTEFNTHMKNMRLSGEEYETITSKLSKFVLLSKEDIDSFFKMFERAHPGFFSHIENHFNSLTQNDKLIISFVVLKMDSNISANVLGISSKSLNMARYRLKAKIKDPFNGNLNEFINYHLEIFQERYYELH